MLGVELCICKFDSGLSACFHIVMEDLLCVGSLEHIHARILHAGAHGFAHDFRLLAAFDPKESISNAVFSEPQRRQDG